MVRNCEPLCDGDFHLSDSTVRDWVQVHKGAVLTMHDEIACRAAFFGYIDEVVDEESATPCWWS